MNELTCRVTKRDVTLVDELDSSSAETNSTFFFPFSIKRPSKLTPIDPSGC